MISLLLAASLMQMPDMISGPQPGKKFGPYTFLIATGPNRGTSHCYVCETGTNPAVIVFARTQSEPLGQFLRQVDQDFFKLQQPKLYAWTTFIGMPQPEKEAELAVWSKKLGLRHIPLGIFEDAIGPPGYQLNREADVTILLVKQNKVVKNFAYPKLAFTAKEVKKVMDALPSITK